MYTFTIFRLSNDMKFGYINRIIYHYIDTFISVAIFKCNMLQRQNQPPFSVKKL